MKTSLKKNVYLHIRNKLLSRELAPGSVIERITGEMEKVAEQVKCNANPIWDTDLADRWLTSDAAFHMFVLRAAGNRRSLKIVRDMHMMSQIFGQRKRERSKDDLDTICNQRRAIVEALRKGDADRAFLVMCEHLRRGCQTALAAYERNRFEREDGLSPSVTYPAELRKRIHEIETTPDENP